MNSPWNALLLESVHEDAHRLLEEHAHLLVAAGPEQGPAWARQHPVDAIITRGKGVVDKALIQACKGLKVIARCGVGLDNIDVESATQHGVKVIHAPGLNAGTIAEHTLALMLMSVRNLRSFVEAVKGGNWNSRNQLPTDELYGKKLGIMGLGNIGRRVASLATAFGMEVRYWDLHAQGNAYQEQSFEDLLSTNDVISLHLPLTAATHHLLSTEALALMPEHAVLINTARGSIIDQAALTSVLQAGRLGAFAADVLEEEPPDAEEPLLQLPNVLITPHAGSLTARTYREMCLQTMQHVVAEFAGTPYDQTVVFNRSQLS